MNMLSMLFAAPIRKVVIGVFLTVGLTGPVDLLQAQESSELAALYGRAVHAFFGGKLHQAEQMLSDCVMAGSTDPRVYYFRGIARLRQGRQMEAEDDLRTGAMFEARDPGLRYGIGNALQRVQGHDRIVLEEFRRNARVERVQERRQQSQQRYEQLRNREPEVLYRSDPLPLEQLAQPSTAVDGSADATVAPQAEVPVARPELPREQPSAGIAPQGISAEPATEVDEFQEPPRLQEAPVVLEDPFGTAPSPTPGPQAAPESSGQPPVEGEEFDSPVSVEQPLDAFESAPIATPGAAVPADELNPNEFETMDTDAAPALTEPLTEGAPEAEDTTIDPFGAETTEAGTEGASSVLPPSEAVETEADPFGAPDEAPVLEPPAEDTSAPAAEDSRVDETEASLQEADPFGVGDEATEEPATEDATATTPAKSESDEQADPFGTEASPAAEQPSADEGADVSDDFAEEADPFGVAEDEVASDEAPSEQAPVDETEDEVGDAESTSEDGEAVDEAAEEGEADSFVDESVVDEGTATEETGEGTTSDEDGSSEEDEGSADAEATDEVDPFGDF